MRSSTTAKPSPASSRPWTARSATKRNSRSSRDPRHAKAGQILGSLGNLPGEVVGGVPAVSAGWRQCHGETSVEGAYSQFDRVVELYNHKFARPAKAIIGELKQRGVISAPEFDDPIEWSWWELWHHEGRRGRHGAAMQGPDYTWWHGLHEAANHFYSQEGHLWHRDGNEQEGAGEDAAVLSETLRAVIHDGRARAGAPRRESA